MDLPMENAMSTDTNERLDAIEQRLTQLERALSEITKRQADELAAAALAEQMAAGERS